MSVLEGRKMKECKEKNKLECQQVHCMGGHKREEKIKQKAELNGGRNKKGIKNKKKWK